MGMVSDPPPRTYPHGVPSWVDTEQPDVDLALAFYGGMFGWTFQDAMPPGAPSRYVIAKLNGADVAAIGSPLESGAPTWNTYVSVDDADEGGSQCRPDRPGGCRIPDLAAAATLGCAGRERARRLELQ